MNFLFVILPIFLLLVTTIPSSFSENSSVTEYGFFGVDQDTYTLAQGDEILVKISGIGEMPSGVERERANITITNPDSSADGHRVFSGNDGYFELLLPISYHSQVGVYKVFATFHGHVLGEVYFTVERMSINDADATSDSSNEEPEHVFAFRTSMFEVETDSLSYEKDSIIYISGAVPTQPKLDLTLQIIDPMNNIILINQITPNPDGTFEDSVNTNSPLWKFEGDYNIRINHNEQDLYSTFSFSIPSPIVVPNPIEPSPAPPKIQEPEVIVEEPVIQNPPPAITSPPPPQATIQESDEFNPSGLIVLAIIFFIIAIIIKKKRGKKSPAQTQSQTYPSMSRQSDSQAVLMQSHSGTPVASTPTKIDDIKVAIQKIDSLIRRNKNKIGECNEELTYYEGPQGGDWVTKDAMIGYYELRIGVLEDLNEDLSKIRSYCDDENTKFAIDSLKTVILGNQDFIRDNHESIRKFQNTSNEFGDETSHLVLEFLEKRHQEYQTEINSCEEIKQIIENSIKSGNSEKQLLINEYKSYAKKLEDSFNKVQKLIDEQSSNWSQYEITAAKSTLEIYKETVDESVQHIRKYSDEDLTMWPKEELQESIQHYKDMIKDTEDSTENILSELEEIHSDLPTPDPSKYTDNVDDKILEKYNFITKTITELKTDLLENRQYYEANSSNSNIQKLLDVLDRLESNVITKNKDTYEMIKTLPDEATEDMRQRFLQELTSISDEPLKEISSSLKELKKKRQEEPDSDEQKLTPIPDDIKKERRERLKKAHPDNGGSEEEFNMVMKEYEIPEKQLLINEYKSYAKKLEDSFNKVQKLVNEQSSNWSPFVIIVAKNTINIYKKATDDAIQEINSQSDEGLAMFSTTELQKPIQIYKDMIKDTEEQTKKIISDMNESASELPKPDPANENTYVDHADEKISNLIDEVTKTLTDVKNEFTENPKYYESIESDNFNTKKIMDDINTLFSRIERLAETYETAKKLPDEISEPLIQQLYESSNIEYEKFKPIIPLLKELEKQRKQETDSDESDKIEFGEDSKSFDSELERRIKQVEEDYYAEKRAERENRDP